VDAASSSLSLRLYTSGSNKTDPSGVPRNGFRPWAVRDQQITRHNRGLLRRAREGHARPRFCSERSTVVLYVRALLFDFSSTREFVIEPGVAGSHFWFLEPDYRALYYDEAGNQIPGPSYCTERSVDFLSRRAAARCGVDASERWSRRRPGSMRSATRVFIRRQCHKFP